MKEPLKYFLEKYKFTISEISEIVIGAKYCAVMLNNGSIGVSANLDNRFKFNINELNNLDLSIYKHRLIYNAYLNAKINFKKKKSTKNEDILKVVDFEKYKKITMVGYFKPVVKKLDDMKINLNIFDLVKSEDRIIEHKLMPEYIAKSDCIILSATSIANNTFTHIVENTPNKCNIFLLGPSTIMDIDMFKFKNITAIFGTKFNLNDQESLNIINNNEGTKHFIKLANKICEFKLK